ncbi:MAG TPA: hypothetical protein VE868_10080 [Balneolaceae bacterium]|nr:hypothetical protein [Balneolaceae bacterium]
MRYIAALDYDHLDNGMFLTALAQSLARQEQTQAIIVHSDSAYTERIIQTGVMRDEATIRSIKGLNHRLVNLFADEGVSTLGINGYQHEFISVKDGRLTMDMNFYKDLPPAPVLLISTLVWDEKNASPYQVSLSRMITFLSDILDIPLTYAFTTSDEEEIIIRDQPDELKWDELPEGFEETHIPDELKQHKSPIHLSTARNLRNITNRDDSILIH